MNALIQSGALPRIEHIPLDGMDDVKTLWKRAGEIGPGGYFVFQVEREVIEKGSDLAVGSAWVLSNMPKSIHGRVILSFQGWADDPRELFEIPCVVDFCRVMLMGSLQDPSLQHAQELLRVLVHEFDLAELIGPDGLEAAGQLWLVSTVFHEEVMSRSYKSQSGIYRDVQRAIAIHKWLLGNGPTPLV